jgi:hypothetical protein
MPLGVVLHIGDRAIPCAVIRDETLDRRGEVAWVAVPAERIALRPGQECQPTAVHLPDNAVVYALSVYADEEARPDFVPYPEGGAD